MLQQTRGIVLHSVKYSETSLIVKIYTEHFGLQSYLVRGIRKQGSKTKPGLFQHLNILDLVVSHKEKASLHSIREVQTGYPYGSLPFDIRKSSIALFMNELLYKSVREEEPNPGLFVFILDSCIYLDKCVEPVTYFHLWFAIHLTAFLGFMPQLNYSENDTVFNLKDGVFQHDILINGYFMEPSLSAIFFRLAECSSEEQSHLKFPVEERNLLVEKLIEYYRLHLSGFAGLRSHQVLHTVLA